MKNALCGYAEVWQKVAPAFKCPPCGGSIMYRIRGYWVAEARLKFGPDMLLCRAHGEWKAGTDPFSGVELTEEKFPAQESQ